MNVQLSVVIPTYKRPKLLLRCLQALLAQQLDPAAYEIIIVSDGPDPATERELTAFYRGKLSRLQHLSLPEKKGPAAARNYGWLAAKGELIVFTDDDCIPDGDFLAAYHQAYLTDKESAFTGKTHVPVSSVPTDYERNISGLETADFITANCACPKKLLLAVGGFDEEFTSAWREDSELEFKFINAGVPIVKISQALVVHPVRQAAWGISLKEQRKTMYNTLLYKKHPALYRRKIQTAPPLHYYAIAVCFILMLTGLAFHSPSLTIIGLVGWLGLSLSFAYRRLRQTNRTPAHILEMTITSLFIPFLSLYWQYYGAIKYRKLLL
jgi:glycosyltransferase involved in cell wall biosynthesis